MALQEVLPPVDRDNRGRFAEGNNAGQGAPPGTQALRKTMRAMILDALDIVGGTQYLAMQAVVNPTAFLGLAGKLLPLKPEPEDGEQTNAITEIRETIVFAPRDDD